MFLRFLFAGVSCVLCCTPSGMLGLLRGMFTMRAMRGLIIVGGGVFRHWDVWSGSSGCGSGVLDSDGAAPGLCDVGFEVLDDDVEFLDGGVIGPQLVCHVHKPWGLGGEHLLFDGHGCLGINVGFDLFKFFDAFH